MPLSRFIFPCYSADDLIVMLTSKSSVERTLLNLLSYVKKMQVKIVENKLPDLYLYDIGKDIQLENFAVIKRQTS